MTGTRSQSDIQYFMDYVIIQYKQYLYLHFVIFHCKFFFFFNDKY